jgi:pseudouridine kinase
VIGGANIDHKSQTLVPAIMGTSNPGRDRTSAGGVGRNVAENLARMSVSTTLMTSVGNDPAGDRLLSEARSAGVDLRHSTRSEKPTDSYTAILDEHGELIIAVSAMESVDALTVEFVEQRRDVIAGAQVLVLDCNVPVETLLRAAELARDAHVPIILDPVSVSKARRARSILANGLPVHTLTPNLDELRELTGVEGSTAVDLRAASARLHSLGVQNVWISLGAAGSSLSSMIGSVQRSTHLSACPTVIVDVTGAGDAMLAGYVAGLLGLSDPIGAATYGHAAAAITVESLQTVNPSIDLAAVIARAGECVLTADV